MIFRPIVRNKTTSDLYEYVGENVFRNLRTGQSGKVTDEAAQKTFVFNIEASNILNEYPLVFEMIEKLNLKHELADNRKQDNGGD